MAAGASADYEAERSLLEAAELERMARAAREQASRYRLACRTEQSVGSRLSALEALGWQVLADRRWVGSKRANVDFLLVGPGGVVVVDVKAWRALQVVNDSLLCDGECRDDEASKLLSLTDRVQDSVSVLGLTRQALWSALVFAGRRLDDRGAGVHLVGENNVAAWVTRLGHRLDEGQVREAAGLLEEEFPPYVATARKRVSVPMVHIAMPQRTPQPESLFDVNELTDSLLEAALAGPIESWMTYLHPDQLKLVSTSWSGPARVRGPAGTGKTVVGLHRASYLAERSPDKVLFVSFVRTLPKVLQSLCQRMSPTATGNIEFTGIHQLAMRILDEAGCRIRIDSGRVETSFNSAWVAVGRDSILEKLDERPSYWKEEIHCVIKGRGLMDFTEYAELNRLGRRTPMRAEHREAMWQLYVDYERRLDAAGVHDFNDALIMARDLIQSGQVAWPCSAVIVDEVQDLNLVGLELLHAIAGDGPDRLLVIGDGQQAVYPGGFSLGEAGISVTGRASVLRSNYRNSQAILDVAAAVVADDCFDDLKGTVARGPRQLDVRRTGGTTQTVRADDRRSLEAALVTHLVDATGHFGVALGDMAVLAYSNSEVRGWRSVLRSAGIATIDLLEYDGVTNDQVKVGTFKRAKGLEFKYVLLPGLVDGQLPRWRGEPDESYRERTERMRRELFVGMTRARDGLWLGYLPADRCSTS